MEGKTKRYIVHDTMEAFLRDLDTDEVFFFGWTTDANVTRSISQEEIKAGIYNKTVAVLQTDDGMEFSITTGVHYEDVMQIQLGSDFKPLTEVTVQEIEEEKDGTFKATEKKVTGDVMDLAAKALPKSYEVQLRSIAYDPDTNAEVADIYWLFHNAQPDGNLNESFSAGSNKTQEITFQAKTPQGEDTYGKYVVVPREDEGNDELGK